jgi:hypothetical protein
MNAADIADTRDNNGHDNPRALPSVLREGDIIATYAGVSRIGAATLERKGRDQFTPLGETTLWTTGGRFDIPDDTRVDVLAWAPLPTNREV